MASTDVTLGTDEWQTLTLGDCVDILDRYRRPINSAERASRRGRVPYYGATGQVGWIDDHLFDEELVLLGEDGAPFLDKSKEISYLVSGKSWVNNHAHVLRARSNITTNKFIKYYLDSFDFTDYVQGSTRDKLTQGAMRSIPIVLPSLDVQTVITDVLDQVAACQTETMGQLAKAQRNIERLRQAVLAYAVSGRLTEDWRALNQKLTDPRMTLGRLQHVARKPRSQELPVDLSLPEVPESYAIANLGDLASAIEYGTSQRCDAAPETGTPVLRMGNIQDGRLDFTGLKYCKKDAEINRLLLQDGDLLFNRTNSPELVGKSAVFRVHGEYSFASYLIRVRVRREVALAEYVNYWINSAWGRAWANLAKTDGVSQSNINGSKLALLPMPLPPIEEQAEIVRRVEAMLKQIEALVEHVEAAGRAATRSSQAVLARVMAGELLTTESPA